MRQRIPTLTCTHSLLSSREICRVWNCHTRPLGGNSIAGFQGQYLIGILEQNRRHCWIALIMCVNWKAKKVRTHHTGLIRLEKMSPGCPFLIIPDLPIHRVHATFTAGAISPRPLGLQGSNFNHKRIYSKGCCMPNFANFYLTVMEQ